MGSTHLDQECPISFNIPVTLSEPPIILDNNHKKRWIKT